METGVAGGRTSATSVGDSLGYTGSIDFTSTNDGGYVKETSYGGGVSTMRKQKFPVDQKITMVNKWRHRCDLLIKKGVPVCPTICKSCDELAKEICEDIKECHAQRGFMGPSSSGRIPACDAGEGGSNPSGPL